MKFLIGLVIIVGLSLGGYQFYQYYNKFKDKDDTSQVPAAAAQAAPEVSGASLSGLPQKLGPKLDVAQQRGAAGLKEFLLTYGDQIQDPRKAWIELDYVELLSQASPGEARQKFKEVEARIEPGSPVYSRVKQLSKTYE